MPDYITSKNVIISDREVWNRAVSGDVERVFVLPSAVLAFETPISITVFYRTHSESMVRSSWYGTELTDRLLDVFVDLTANPTGFSIAAVANFEIVVNNPEVVYASNNTPDFKAALKCTQLLNGQGLNEA